ncbi:MAG: serine hydrolase [Pseudomonadota bacterium]
MPSTVCPSLALRTSILEQRRQSSLESSSLDRTLYALLFAVLVPWFSVATAEVSNTAVHDAVVSDAVVSYSRPPGLSGDNWQFGPHNRWAYTHLTEVLPSKKIRNDPQRTIPLLGRATAEKDMIIDWKGGRSTLSTVAADQYIDGILVLHKGKVHLEYYGGTLTAERTHLLWSVSKTVAGLTFAAVADAGLVDVDKSVADYVPELAESGWGADKLRDLLDMRDSSSWNEDYDAPDSTVRRQDCADGLLTGPACEDVPVVGNYLFLPKVTHDAQRAGKFAYKSGTVDVLAWVLEAATGRRFADLVSHYVWKPMGAERDADITVDIGGFTLASGGMQSTLGDLARVGLLMANRGRAGATQVVSTSWLDDMFSRDGSRAWPLPSSPGHKPYYRTLTWGIGDGRGTVQARGVHGQTIHVVPEHDIVIAVFSSWPAVNGGAPGSGPETLMELLAAIEVAVLK